MLALAQAKASQLRDRFRATRQQTNSLCEGLIADDYFIQATDDVSPPKWHLAHTSWFFDRFVVRELFPNFSLGQDFDYLFNSYYQTLGSFQEKNRRDLMARPSLDEIFKYRKDLEEKMEEVFELSDLSSEILETIQLGIQHEQQHQELLLMDIKMNFSVQLTQPVYSIYARSKLQQEALEIPSARWLEVDGGDFLIGHSDDSLFCFDNEKPLHQIRSKPFKISSQLVRNSDYLEFVESGAYQESRWWLSDGWEWLRKARVSSPVYWKQLDGQWFEFSLGGLIELHADRPLSHISFYEAQAYANWSRCRLPTEYEWEVAAQTQELESTTSFLESGLFHPQASEVDFFGELWQWTASSYFGYPGYQAYSGSLAEYNSKFMCNQFVLRGGCRLTPKTHFRKTYRNFYFPHQNWCMTGLRLAKDIEY